MRARSATISLSVVLVLLLLATAVAVILSARPVGEVMSTRFSAAKIDPDAQAALKAQGRKLGSPFPNSANEGRKFNPTGGAIPALVTPAEQKCLTLFVDFPDLPPGVTAAPTDLQVYDDLLFGTTYDRPEYAAFPDRPLDRTLKNYFKDASFGTLDVTTGNMPSTLGWITMSHPYSWYCSAGAKENGFGAYPANVQGIVVEAIEQADPYIDFSQYADSNGVMPNLFVVFRGTGAEWSGAPDIIWSHSWDLSEGTGLDGYTVDGVKLNNYAMMPELGGDLTGFSGTVSGPYPPTVGVFAHEYAHVLGLPDQYDYGYESEGTGIYSLMAGGSWNRYPNNRLFSGNSPSMLDAWSKYRLGFIDPVEITAGSFSIPAAETNAVAYKMTVPFSGGREYFLFENRQQTNWDKGFLRFGAGGTVHGLAVYHVDDTVFSRNYWRPNEAQNWKEFRSEGNKKAETGETHYGISILQADGKWNLEHYNENYGDDGDLYPGSSGATMIGNTTKPNTSSYYFWGGSAPKFGYSGVTVKNIVESGGVVSADFGLEPRK